MKKRQMLRMLLSLAVGAAAFLFLALVLCWPVWLGGLVGVGLYFALWFLTAPAEGSGAAFLETHSGGELDEMLQEAARDLKQLRRSAAQVQDGAVRRQGNALADTGEKILEYLHANPQKIPSTRRFLTYYIDTTGKILRQYVQFQQAGLQTAEVAAFQAKVRDLLPRLCAEFDRQFSRLMADERFDLEADMDVIDNMLKSEGIE